MGKNVIYSAASYVWRNTFLKWHRDRKAQKEKEYWLEHRKHFGKENADKTFYVIRRYDWYCGLFSHYLTVLQHIDDALEAGQIPIVDMQNSFNIYLPESKIGTENSWEYYFEQPCGYSLQDIAKSANVIIGDGKVPKMFPYLDIKFLDGTTGELKHWRELAHKYIRLSDASKEYVENIYSKLINDNDKVLGVLCRGTDYTNGKPKNHPIQPTVREAVAKVKDMMAEGAYNKIFLATEDEKFYKAFSEEFGNALIVNNPEYHEYTGGAFGRELYEKDDCVSGYDYLTNIYILSKCNGLCAGCTSGTVGALLMNEDSYEEVYLFDLGIYE